MKKLLFLGMVFTMGAFAGAQTNSPAPAPAPQEIGLHADHFYYEGNARQIVYEGHVVVTNAQSRLSCGKLTINLPPAGAADNHPTNAVAETNLDIVYVDTKKGETNELTADKGVYDYSVVRGVTNELFTFTGHARLTSANGWMTAEPLKWDRVINHFYGDNPVFQYKTRAGDTNGSPFNLGP
jgi:lipopolysaccharide export system protein LptA